tara:strand:- start:231 stop:464 length:234 start_codon:yes stop_codon:yes gene_type:complete
MKFLNFDFNKIKKFLERLTEVLLLVVATSLLFGVLFGPDTAFVGNVYQNLISILAMVGQDGLIALVSVLVILAVLKK